MYIPDIIIPAGELSPALKISNTNCPVASSSIAEDLGSFIIPPKKIPPSTSSCLNAEWELEVIDVSRYDTAEINP